MKFPMTRLRRYVAAACDGPFGSAIKSDHYVDEGARVIRLGNIGCAEWRDADRAFIDIEYWRTLQSHHASPGDIVVAGLGDEGNPVGRACVVPPLGPAIVKADCYRLRLNALACPLFIAYFLSSAAGVQESAAISEGSTRPRLTLGKALSLRTPDLSLEDQVTIAAFLDSETSRIDSLIHMKEQIVGLVWSRRTCVLEDSIRSLVRNHGAFPLKYASVKIEVGIVITPSAWYAESGVIALRGLNIKPGTISLDDVVRISAEGHRIHRKSTLCTGDVVVVRTGQAGAAAVVPPELDGSNCVDLLIIRPSDNIIPEFLAFVINCDWTQKHVDEFSVGTIQSHFNVGAIKEVPIPIPPKPVQRRVVEVLSANTARTAQIATRLDSQIALLRERREALITAAVTGQLDIPGVSAA